MEKPCITCKQLKEVGFFYKDSSKSDGLRPYCKDCQRDKNSKTYQKNKEKRKEGSSRYYSKNREKMCRASQEYTKNNKERRRQTSSEDYQRNVETYKLRRREKRVKAITFYGGECVCCGIDEVKFLAFDHINNDGSEHRRQIKMNIVDWIIKNNYPDMIQLLCHNCNMAKSFYDGCPHNNA